jgi:Lipocalin-like domain
MNRLRVFLVAGVLAVAVSVVATGPAAAKGDSVATSNANSTIKRELVGTWDLVSFVLLDSQNALVAYPYGQPPAGSLTYTEDGHVWALVGPTGPPTADLPAAWYTGTFRVDAKRRVVIRRSRGRTNTRRREVGQAGLASP